MASFQEEFEAAIAAAKKLRKAEREKSSTRWKVGDEVMVRSLALQMAMPQYNNRPATIISVEKSKRPGRPARYTAIVTDSTGHHREIFLHNDEIAGAAE